MSTGESRAMKDQTKINVFRNPASRRTELYIWQRVGDKIGAVESVNILEVLPGEESMPSLYLDDESCLELLQSLWNQGYRPANYLDESAQKAHLEDMRKIAFKFLELK